MTSFSEYLSDIPLLHTWDDGKNWNSGGFDRHHLERLIGFLRERLPADASIIETGAGNSTIAMLFLKPARLVSIAPDAKLFDRIRSFCAANGLPTDALSTHNDCSEWVLPRLAGTPADGQLVSYDFALIDGCHNYPNVFIDFFYINAMLKAGGYLMIDDVNLHSVKELARMLAEQPDFQPVLDLGKSLVYQRVSDQRWLGEWNSSPYLVRKLAETEARGNPYAL